MKLKTVLISTSFVAISVGAFVFGTGWQQYTSKANALVASQQGETASAPAVEKAPREIQSYMDSMNLTSPNSLYSSLEYHSVTMNADGSQRDLVIHHMPFDDDYAEARVLLSAVTTICNAMNKHGTRQGLAVVKESMGIYMGQMDCVTGEPVLDIDLYKYQAYVQEQRFQADLANATTMEQKAELHMQRKLGVY